MSHKDKDDISFDLKTTDSGKYSFSEAAISRTQTSDDNLQIDITGLSGNSETNTISLPPRTPSNEEISIGVSVPRLPPKPPAFLIVQQPDNPDPFVDFFSPRSNTNQTFNFSIPVNNAEPELFVAGDVPTGDPSTEPLSLTIGGLDLEENFEISMEPEKAPDYSGELKRMESMRLRKKVEIEEKTWIEKDEKRRELERLEQDRIQKEKEEEEQRERLEKERIQKEKERLEQERLQKEKERLEKERIQKEKERLEQERLQKEKRTIRERTPPKRKRTTRKRKIRTRTPPKRKRQTKIRTRPPRNTKKRTTRKIRTNQIRPRKNRKRKA